MQRLERLINLMAALLDSTRPLSRREIHERVPGYAEDENSFRRAFERDKDALRSMGVPLVTEPLDALYPDHGEGYRIPPEQYQLPDPGLTTDELAALHVAATAVSLADDAEVGEQALWKLGGKLGSDTGRRAALPGSACLPDLFEAIGKRRSVTFLYKGQNRTVDPYHLAFRSGHWYLIASDHDRGEERSFRVDRIESIEFIGTDGQFDTPATFRRIDLAPWELGDDDPVLARLRVESDQSDWVLSQMGEDATVVAKDDTGVSIEVPVRNREAFRSFALGLLDRAVIEGPPELRSDMIDWLESIGGRS